MLLKYKPILVSFLLFIMYANGYSKTQPVTCRPINKAPALFFKKLSQAPASPMSQRLEWISRHFLASPYQLFILGDGPNDLIDQCPIHRLDAFDCETFVTSVLALALSQNEEEYKQCLNTLRYRNGQVGYLTRHHFTSIDWNKNNQAAGRLKDITRTLVDKNHHPVFRWSKTWIDKAAWFQRTVPERMRVFNSDEKRNLALFIQKTHSLQKVHARLPYIPLTALFSPEGKGNMDLFNQIPDAAIIEIVRPNWELKDKIGTNLDVSHLGFAFRRGGEFWFRNASSQLGKVTDQPLISYLDSLRSSPTIKGINVQVFLPKAPGMKYCKTS